MRLSFTTQSIIQCACVRCERRRNVYAGAGTLGGMARRWRRRQRWQQISCAARPPPQHCGLSSLCSRSSASAPTPPPALRTLVVCCSAAPVQAANTYTFGIQHTHLLQHQAAALRPAAAPRTHMEDEWFPRSPSPPVVRAKTPPPAPQEAQDEGEASAVESSDPKEEVDGDSEASEAPDAAAAEADEGDAFEAAVTGSTRPSIVQLQEPAQDLGPGPTDEQPAEEQDASEPPPKPATPPRSPSPPLAAKPPASPPHPKPQTTTTPAVPLTSKPTAEVISSISVEARDPDAAVLLSALTRLYMDKLRPIEERIRFADFHHHAMTEADLQAKPQVLLLGQYSTGKTTFIKHFIGRDFPSMHIGPEPSTEAFQAVMSGTEDRLIKGTALCLIDELPFTGLSQFGATFLNHFEASICDAELLEHITFVDTPGVLVSEKQGAQRGYSFTEAVKWFADRSDMILLVFDVHKLDISEEFRQLIAALDDHADKLRIVLNKAQEVDADRLIKVFGALMWGVGRAFRHKSEVPKVYVGSFWDGSKRHPDSEPDDDTFEQDEAALRRELMQLPRNVGLRKINEMTKRAKLAKVHACILDHLRRAMPWFGGEAAQARLLASLPEVFADVQRKYGFPDGDMPKIARYSAVLQSYNFGELPRLDRYTLRALDELIEHDIKQVVARGGGVDRIFKMTSEAKVVSADGGYSSGGSALHRRLHSHGRRATNGDTSGGARGGARRGGKGGGRGGVIGAVAALVAFVANLVAFIVACALVGLALGGSYAWATGHEILLPQGGDVREWAAGVRARFGLE